MSSGIVRHLLESTAFALVVAFVIFTLRSRSAAVRYRLWLLAAFKFTLPASLLVILGQWFHRVWMLESRLPINSYFSGPSLLARPGDLLSATVLNEAFWKAFSFLWMLGTLLSFGIWLHRMARADRPTTNAPVSAIQMVSRLKHRIGLRRSVEVRSAVSGGELALSGVWSSVMILPQGLSESLTESEMEAVLLHELLHAKRWDNLAAVFIHTLVCLFWFHPILWWIERKLIAERELACDEAVIAHGSSAKEYMAGILKVCRFHLIELQPSVCGVTGSNLRKRMELIMSYSGRFAQRCSRLILSLLGALMTIEPFAMGFLQAPVLYGRVDDDERQSKPAGIQKTVNCVANSKSYLEGTTVELEGKQQLCVKSFFGKPLWVRTTPEARDRSRTVVMLPKLQPTICEPRASSSAKLCACQDGSYSPGAIVNSAKGKLTCAAGKWRLSTRQELGYK